MDPRIAAQLAALSAPGQQVALRPSPPPQSDPAAFRRVLMSVKPPPGQSTPGAGAALQEARIAALKGAP